MADYVIVNGTSYDAETPAEVVKILESYRRQPALHPVDPERLRIFYGDSKTGQIWEDEPVSGYVSRSTGDVKIPLLIYRKGSTGGEAIMDRCIMRIELSRGKKLLYLNPLCEEWLAKVQAKMNTDPRNITVASSFDKAAAMVLLNNTSEPLELIVCENTEPPTLPTGTIEQVKHLLDCLDGWGIVYSDEVFVSDRLADLGFRH